MNTKIAQKIKELPKTPGIYIYRNLNGKVIYVGKAVNLKNRVSSYFQARDLDPKTKELVKNITNLEWIEVASEFEALILEAEFIKRYKPKYNIDWKDDKNYGFIKLTKGDFPRVSLVHQVTDHEAKYIGPFIEVTAVRTVLKLARRIFPYCTCNLPKDEVCLYYHLGLCPGHGSEYISKKDYQKNLNGLLALLQGKTGKLEKEFKSGMKKASKERRFEEAADFRDKLRFLIRLKKTHLFTDRDLSTDKGLSQLAEYLKIEKIPTKIECFDISNVLGTAAVGSMVVFRGGIASPRDYRRFQIKTVKGADDFRMLSEILGRRFKLGNFDKHTVSDSTEEEETTKRLPKKHKDSAFSDIPELVILDGGKGQLSAVLKRVVIPNGVKVVALAKRREEIFSIKDGGFEKIILPVDSEAMYLVQRIRDEAHRFAVSYHRKVKGREAFETSLDAIIGIGPKTKKKLIKEFGSVKKIKETSLEDLSKVAGPKIAAKLKEEL